MAISLICAMQRAFGHNLAIILHHLQDFLDTGLEPSYIRIIGHSAFLSRDRNHALTR